MGDVVEVKRHSISRKYPGLVSRLLQLSKDVWENSSEAPRAETTLTRYCEVNMTTTEDFTHRGNSLLPGEMSDNMLLEAGIASLQPKAGVVLMSTTFQTWLRVSSDRYSTAVRRGEPFLYDTCPYDMLVETTRNFECIPTILIPVHMHLHWGYIVVLPDSQRCSATVMWGDSLRYDPPGGMLEVVRAYLALLYRTVSFFISRQNHALDILRLQVQQDGYSCGFYVIAAFSTFCDGSTDDKFPKDVFHKYDPQLTERYRVSCLRTLVLHILLVGVGDNGKGPVAFDVFQSLKDEMGILVEAANLGARPMYKEVLPSIRKFLMREHNCVSLEGVRDLEKTDDTGDASVPRSGLFSIHTAKLSPRPFVRTVPLSLSMQSLSFREQVDISTIFGHQGQHGSRDERVNPVRKEYRDPRLREKARLACEKAQSKDCSKPDMDTDLGPKEDDAEENKLCRAVTPQVDAGIRTSGHNVWDCVEDERDYVQWTRVDVIGNFIAYYAKRLEEGHSLRKPEYHFYKNSESAYAFRLRLRCRLYEPPLKWKKPLAEYERCKVQLYARLHKCGGWRVTFRFRHNHRIWSSSFPDEAKIRKRLEHFVKSLSSNYAGTMGEMEAWSAGARFVGEPCPALDGSWTSNSAQDRTSASTQDGTTGSGSKPKPDFEQGSSCYLPIAPRPPHQSQDNPFFAESPHELVAPLTTLGLPLAEPRVGAGLDVRSEDIIPLRVEVQDTLYKYIQSCHVSTDGRHVRDQVKYISECFGFQMLIRDSRYYYDCTEPEVQRGPPQVKRLVFKCPVGSGTKLRKECRHSFTVVTTASEYVKMKDGNDAREGDECLSRPLVVKFDPKWHSHKASEESLRKCLPPQVWKEALRLRDKSLLPTPVIARHIEDTTGISINRRTLARKLQHEMRKRHPVQNDCHKLISNLFSLSRRYPGMFTEARVLGDNSLHSVCWGFPQWREEYHRFGILPGVAIDAKAVANNYDTPLAFICGRTNNRAVTIFFMGFLATQRGDDFLWFMQQFEEFSRVPPRLIACDQDAAILNAAEKVFPSAAVILDDWHLNRNQTKNCESAARKQGRPEKGKDMSDGLYKLRASKTQLEFLQNRRRWEEEYFPTGELPQWYRTLYYTYARQVVLCYNRTTCGERFLFQGSGYVESANSQYHRIIMDRKVPMSRIPEEVFRYSEERKAERQGELRISRFLTSMAKVSMSQFGYGKELWEQTVEKFLPFAWDGFFDNSVKVTHKYTVADCQEQAHECYGDMYSFVVSIGNEAEGNLRLYNVACPKDWENLHYVPGMCSCNWSTSAGLPCRHAARVAIVFREYTGANSRFPLELMFHPYWRRDRQGWGDADIVRSRFGERITGDGSGEVEPDNEDEEDREAERVARLQTVLWSNGHSTWNQIHQRVAKKGVGALQKLDRLMALLLEEVTRNRERDNLDFALVTRHLKESMELEMVPSTEPRRLDIARVATGESAPVRNSSQGKVKGRGKTKRARSWTEKKGRITKNRKVSKRSTEQGKSLSQPEAKAKTKEGGDRRQTQ